MECSIFLWLNHDDILYEMILRGNFLFISIMLMVLSICIFRKFFNTNDGHKVIYVYIPTLTMGWLLGIFHFPSSLMLRSASRMSNSVTSQRFCFWCNNQKTSLVEILMENIAKC